MCITTIKRKLVGLRSAMLKLFENDKGVTLITVVALLLMMVVAFAALFGSSYLSAGKAQITNIANVTALAAV